MPVLLFAQQPQANLPWTRAHSQFLIYDPRKGDKIAQCLSLQGNPSEKTDFFIELKTNEVYDFSVSRKQKAASRNTSKKTANHPSQIRC